jgi:hypothetical protein
MCPPTMSIIEYLEAAVDIRRVAGIVVAFLVVVLVIGRFASNPSHTAATSVAASPADQSLAADKWQLSESRSPMDDSKTVVLSLKNLS